MKTFKNATVKINRKKDEINDSLLVENYNKKKSRIKIRTFKNVIVKIYKKKDEIEVENLFDDSLLIKEYKRVYGVNCMVINKTFLLPEKIVEEIMNEMIEELYSVLNIFIIEKSFLTLDNSKKYLEDNDCKLFILKVVVQIHE